MADTPTPREPARRTHLSRVVHWPGEPAHSVPGLPYEDVVAALEVAAAAHSTADDLTALPWRHPQVFLTLAARRTFPSGHVRNDLLDLADEGPEKIVIYGDQQYTPLTLSPWAWWHAVLGIADLNPAEARRLCHTAAEQPGRWTDRPDRPGLVAAAMLTCPAVDEVAAATFLDEASRAAPRRRDGTAYRVAVALRDADRLAGHLVVSRWDAPGPFMTAGDDWIAALEAATPLPRAAHETVVTLAPTWSGTWHELFATALAATATPDDQN